MAYVEKWRVMVDGSSILDGVFCLINKSEAEEFKRILDEDSSAIFEEFGTLYRYKVSVKYKSNYEDYNIINVGR